MTPAQFRTIRQNAGLSLDGLAKLLGISSRSTVHKWEKGIDPISGPVSRIMLAIKRGLLTLDQLQDLGENA